MNVIVYDEWIKQSENLTKQQLALLKAQNAIGKSAYEIYLDENNLTEEDISAEDWLETLRGPRGYKGNKGKSAFEQAVEGGYGGEEEDFIALLGNLGNLNEALDEIIGDNLEELDNTLDEVIGEEI